MSLFSDWSVSSAELNRLGKLNEERQRLPELPPTIASRSQQAKPQDLPNIRCDAKQREVKISSSDGKQTIGLAAWEATKTALANLKGPLSKIDIDLSATHTVLKSGRGIVDVPLTLPSPRPLVVRANSLSDWLGAVDPKAVAQGAALRVTLNMPADTDAAAVEKTVRALVNDPSSPRLAGVLNKLGKLEVTVNQEGGTAPVTFRISPSDLQGAKYKP